MRNFLLVFLLFVSFKSMAILQNETFIVEIKAQDPKERSHIAQMIHIDSVTNDRVFAVVNSDDMKTLLNDEAVQIVSAESLSATEHLSTYYEPFVGEVDFPERDALFHTFDEMVAALRSYEADHPSLASLFSLGKSIEDRDIWALRISDDGPDAIQDKKAIVFMGTHHAREHVSTEIPILFADKILNLYDIDPEISTLLKKVEIFVVPLVNPDGATYDIVGRRYKWWRKNRRSNQNGSYGVDLNRNYGFGWGTGGSSSNPGSDVYMGEEAFSEPETQAIRNFLTEHQNVTIAISLHTFSELILYPWGGQNDGVGGDDEIWFKNVSRNIARMNHYRPMQSSELYIASGDTCDWAYGELGIYCLTFELSPSSMFGGGFYPGADIIERVFDDNYNPMIYLSNLAQDPKAAIP